MTEVGRRMKKDNKANFKFENLDVWKEAINFAQEIYQVTKNFPKEEQFSLTSQLRRAAVSISSNIAEGSARRHDKDFIRFLRIALGSTFEVISQLHIAKVEKCLVGKDFENLYEHGFKIANMLGAFINRLDKNYKHPTSDIRHPTENNE